MEADINTTVWTEILSSTATLAAVLVALWVAILGPRRVTKPKLLAKINLASPECTWSPSSEERERGNGLAQAITLFAFG